jgi:hypothetical protein
MARKVKDARAAKDARQKKIAIVGAILLVAVLAFQVPRTMKMLKGAESSSAAPAAPAAATPPGSTSSLEPPSLGGGITAAPAGNAPAATDGGAGRLVSFGRFESKDPFRPQIDSSKLGGGEDAPTTAPGAAKPPAEPDGGGRSSSPPVTATPRPAPAPANTTSAVISVNGVPERVAVGAAFPAAEPTFELVSLTAKAAKIAIAGGSYASGDATITLKRGESLTLMNTSNGRRYELRWLPDSAAPAAAAAAPAPAAPATPAAPAPTGS